MNHVWSSGTLKLEALMCEKNVSESHVEKGVMLLRCMRVCVCVGGCFVACVHISLSKSEQDAVLYHCVNI